MEFVEKEVREEFIADVLNIVEEALINKNGLKHNNNHIERYNQDIKDRIKTMRNFGSDEGAEYFLNLRHIIHNFVNPHMGLNGKTPAECAEIDLRLGRRKLLNLIRYRAKTKMTTR